MQIIVSATIKTAICDPLHMRNLWPSHKSTFAATYTESTIMFDISGQMNLASVVQAGASVFGFFYVGYQLWQARLNIRAATQLSQPVMSLLMDLFPVRWGSIIGNRCTNKFMTHARLSKLTDTPIAGFVLTQEKPGYSSGRPPWRATYRLRNLATVPANETSRVSLPSGVRQIFDEIGVSNSRTVAENPHLTG